MAAARESWLSARYCLISVWISLLILFSKKCSDSRPAGVMEYCTLLWEVSCWINWASFNSCRASCNVKYEVYSRFRKKSASSVFVSGVSDCSSMDRIINLYKVSGSAIGDLLFGFSGRCENGPFKTRRIQPAGFYYIMKRAASEQSVVLRHITENMFRFRYALEGCSGHV